MPSLHDLLDEAAGQPRPFDAAADLHRVRRAASRRRSRWAVGVTGGLVAAGAVTLAVLPHGGGEPETVSPADNGPSGGSGLASNDVVLRYYDVPPPPTGWHVVGDRPQYVMITRDGSGVTTIDSGFVGQIVVMLTPGVKAYDGISDQPSTQYDGRTFYRNGQDGGAGMTTASVRTEDGNWLQIQYPSADFGFQDMVTYLDGVVVKAGALPGDPSIGSRDFHVIRKNGGLYYLRDERSGPSGRAERRQQHPAK